MPKREETKTGKSKMTVMVFQLEGNDETLQEGLKRISQALDNAIRPSVRLVSSSQALPGMASSGGNGQVEDSQETDDDSDSNEMATDEAEEVAESPRRLNRSFKSPKILDLDLNAGKVPLEDYCKQKVTTEEDSRRYLAITMWLKENLGIQEVSMDHIHTCYRRLGWITPKDATQTMRNLKSKGLFHKGEGVGFYKINHIGENALLKAEGT